jgi:beta-glucosidase
MPFTLPVSLEQSPAHALGNFPGRNLKVNYEEDILVGYRWFDSKKIVPQFSFGYGLSYTSFELSDLSSDKTTHGKDDVISVKFNVTNTGARYGAEVAQLYVSDPVCSVVRPVRELKNFKKVFLLPGETKTVGLNVKVSDLAFYDEAIKDWNVEAGDFILEVGNSSGNISHTLKVTVR